MNAFTKDMQKFIKAKTSLFIHIIRRSSVNVSKPITNARIAKDADVTLFKVPAAEIDTQLTKLQEVYGLQLHWFMYVVMVASIPAMKYNKHFAKHAHESI